MSTIRISKHIESDTITLPELRAFVGRRVEISIEESTPLKVSTPSSPDWDAVLAAAQTLEDYDYSARSEQDARDVRDAKEL